MKALLHAASEHQVPLGVIGAVEEANIRQKGVMFRRLKLALGESLVGARVAVWGLSFKPQTDDLRESPSLDLIEALLAAGAEVVAHDPVAMPHARAIFGDRITFGATNYETLDGAHALAIVTDWNEYRHPNFERMRDTLARPIVIDGRNLYSGPKMKSLGFTYYSIGRIPG